jgi:uncharacterized protein (TIGR02284 family)
MQTPEVVDVLNDLIEINNDRIEGYRRAADEAKDIDADLKALFARYMDMSEANKTALAQKVLQYKPDADVESGTTASGKFYRMWMDLKATFTGHSRQAVLESCEFGEDAAQKVYKDVLAENSLPADVRELVTTQKASLREAHDYIKNLRDREKASL